MNSQGSTAETGRGRRGGAIGTLIILFAVSCGALSYLGMPSLSAPTDADHVVVADDAFSQSAFARQQASALGSHGAEGDSQSLVLDEWDPNAVTRGRPQPGKKPSPPNPHKKK